jgi:hypothetical protein
MKRVVCSAALVVLSAGTLVFAQAGDVKQILAEARGALGGETKLVGLLRYGPLPQWLASSRHRRRNSRSSCPTSS